MAKVLKESMSSSIGAEHVASAPKPSNESIPTQSLSVDYNIETMCPGPKGGHSFPNVGTHDSCPEPGGYSSAR